MSLSSQGPWLGSGTDGHLCPPWAKVNTFKSSPLICHHLCKFRLLELPQHKQNPAFPGDHSVKGAADAAEGKSALHWKMAGWVTQQKKACQKQSDLFCCSGSGLAQGGRWNPESVLGEFTLWLSSPGFSFTPSNNGFHSPFVFAIFSFYTGPFANRPPGKETEALHGQQIWHKKIKPSYQTELVPNAGSGLAASWKVILLPSDMALKQVLIFPSANTPIILHFVNTQRLSQVTVPK